MFQTIYAFIEPEHQACYTRLSRKAIADSLYINEATLQHFELYDEVQHYISVGQIHRLFEIQDPSYKDLTLEFLCTLRSDAKDLLAEMPTTISFRTGGLIYHLTMDDFCLAIGLYIAEEIAAPEYRQLIYATHSFLYIDLWR